MWISRFAHHSISRTAVALMLVPLLPASRIAGDNVARSVWVRNLQSDLPSEFRIAQAYLARPGARPLDELDELARTRDPRLRQRLKEVVALMLLHGLDPHELRVRRHLHALPQEEFTKAAELATQLRRAVEKAAAAKTNSAEGVQWYLLDDRRPTLANELLLLHGWAVPALLELSEHETPFLKMFCVDTILVSHGGRLPASAFERLRNDHRALTRFSGDSADRSTIARELDAIIKSHPYLAEKESVADWHRCLALLHQFQRVTLREDQVLTSFDSQWSFDEYWGAAQREIKLRWDPPEASDK